MKAKSGEHLNEIAKHEQGRSSRRAMLPEKADRHGLAEWNALWRFHPASAFSHNLLGCRMYLYWFYSPNPAYRISIVAASALQAEARGTSSVSLLPSTMPSATAHFMAASAHSATSAASE